MKAANPKSLGPAITLFHIPGMARLFCSRAKFENNFSSGEVPYKISYDFCKAEFFMVVLMHIEKNYVQILS